MHATLAAAVDGDVAVADLWYFEFDVCLVYLNDGVVYDYVLHIHCGYNKWTVIVS